MLTRVIGCKTTWNLWDKIHSYFHVYTNAKARQLCNKLCNTDLESCIVSDFLLCIQSLVDALTVIEDSTSSKKHLDIILEALLEEYKSIVSLISSRFDELSIVVETVLLAHEACLEKFKRDVASINIA
uniref:Retrovirus-related Pol polyprotein from transposon TNT 1-94 n=1 Tax=Cajanus cajan TaxID=3821 RepID=A0A151SF04_CAJCA|nr:hypothetical protein KK1_024898 [Cajanus cajan]